MMILKQLKKEYMIRTLLLLTCKLKIKIDCEHKNLLDNKMDNINNSISILDKNINKTDYKSKTSINKGTRSQINTTQRTVRQQPQIQTAAHLTAKYL